MDEIPWQRSKDIWWAKETPKRASAGRGGERNRERFPESVSKEEKERGGRRDRKSERGKKREGNDRVLYSSFSGREQGGFQLER